MDCEVDDNFYCACRAPRGARGLKSAGERAGAEYIKGRAPRGARGLKSRLLDSGVELLLVVPLAGHVD